MLLAPRSEGRSQDRTTFLGAALFSGFHSPGTGTPERRPSDDTRAAMSSSWTGRSLGAIRHLVTPRPTAVSEAPTTRIEVTGGPMLS